jgi:sugar lactone lactonase YvrE
MEHRSRAASLLKNHTHSANAEGKRIGKILLAERCSNLCFSDLRKNRLFVYGRRPTPSRGLAGRGLQGPPARPM